MIRGARGSIPRIGVFFFIFSGWTVFFLLYYEDIHSTIYNNYRKMFSFGVLSS
jgi:hypothetical protein